MQSQRIINKQFYWCNKVYFKKFSFNERKLSPVTYDTKSIAGPSAEIADSKWNFQTLLWKIYILYIKVNIVMVYVVPV